MNIAINQTVNYVAPDGKTRKGKVVEVLGAKSARIDISTGTPGTDSYKEAYAIAEFNEDKTTPNTFHAAPEKKAEETAPTAK